MDTRQHRAGFIEDHYLYSSANITLLWVPFPKPDLVIMVVRGGKYYVDILA